jgi:Protein of unknown function (DUF2510)
MAMAERSSKYIDGDYISMPIGMIAEGRGVNMPIERRTKQPAKLPSFYGGRDQLETKPEETATPEPVYTSVAATTAPTPIVQQIAQAAQAGWYGDPLGRYEQRYWDGGTWTQHVATAGAVGVDTPPPAA